MTFPTLCVRRRRRVRPGLAVAGAVVALLLGTAGCGSGGSHLSDAQIKAWLAKVQTYGDDEATMSTCFLIPRAQLPTTVSHPPGPWHVEGYNDESGGRGFAGCGIEANSGHASDGEIGIELTSAVGRDPDTSTVARKLPGTSWTVTVTAWPGTGTTSSAEASRVEKAVEASLATPPSDPSAYASPADPFTG